MGIWMPLGSGISNAAGRNKPRINAVTRRAAAILDANSALLLLVKEQRCEQSYKELFVYYSPRICTFLRQRGADHRTAQDIAQEVMVKIWRKADQFDPTRAKASTWIFTITRNQYIDNIRRTKRYEVDADDPLLVQALPVSPEELMMRQCDQTDIAVAMKSLPSQQEEVLTLSYVQGKKQREIAEELAIPLNTVKSRLRLGIERLRKAMENR